MGARLPAFLPLDSALHVPTYSLFVPLPVCTVRPVQVSVPPLSLLIAPLNAPQPQIYNRRLDERERRRQFVLDRGLLNIKRQQVCAGPMLTAKAKRS